MDLSINSTLIFVPSLRLSVFFRSGVIPVTIHPIDTEIQTSSFRLRTYSIDLCFVAYIHRCLSALFSKAEIDCLSKVGDAKRQRH